MHFDYGRVENPVWSLPELHLRDPAALVHDGLIYLFFTLFDPRKQTWCVAMATTEDFGAYSEIVPISPPGYASPGNVIPTAHGWTICYQQYARFPHYLCLAHSPDLRNWSPPAKIFNTGPENRWNSDARVIDPFLVPTEEMTYCFYTGSTRWGKPSGHNLIGVAGSTDLVHWRDLSPERPVIGVDCEWEQPDGNENNCVIRHRGRYFMLYSAALARQRIAAAVSDDLLHWEKLGLCDVPAHPAADSYGAPFIITGLGDPETFYMIYQGCSAEGHLSFLLRTSRDLMHWR